MTFQNTTLNLLREKINAAAQQAGSDHVRLVVASKTQSAATIQACVAAGQNAFGENYVTEALAKQAQLASLAIEWHCIGPLQSNKCTDVARHFDWLQSLDRAKLVPLLAHARPSDRPPLNVLIQVNIDAEASKSGCSPQSLGTLADLVALSPQLTLRGIMAIPAPAPEAAQRQRAFAQLRHLFDQLKRDHPAIDTLSMGMSDDFLLAIAAGATMVRVGSALFGARKCAK